eukprot:scaffold29899_cov19-Tisochrysis_lutea.AAC.1
MDANPPPVPALWDPRTELRGCARGRGRRQILRQSSARAQLVAQGHDAQGPHAQEPHISSL